METPAHAPLPVHWRPRSEPLPALAVAATGPAAVALARRALQAPEQVLSHWSGVAGPGVLVLQGESHSLPWVDGVLYLGREPAAPSLLLPCTLVPTVAPALLERALVLHGRHPTPLAVLPQAGQLIPLGPARPVARSTLAAWLARQEARP